jgi:hypothetical protein
MTGWPFGPTGPASPVSAAGRSQNRGRRLWCTQSLCTYPLFNYFFELIMIGLVGPVGLPPRVPSRPTGAVIALVCSIWQQLIRTSRYGETAQSRTSQLCRLESSRNAFGFLKPVDALEGRAQRATLCVYQ